MPAIANVPRVLYSADDTSYCKRR